MRCPHPSACLLAALLLPACPAPKDTATTDTGAPEAPVDADEDGYYATADCDDSDPAIHPGAEEVCDGEDNDCNGQIDENVTLTTYPDADGDGFGDPAGATDACDTTTGYVQDGTDCDDTDASRNLAAPEICDGLDNNCNGVADEGATGTYYEDADGDGFGNLLVPTQLCAGGPGWVTDATDCDDTNASVHPSAVEDCDSLDNDCDRLVDEDAAGSSTWYLDADGDEYGDPDHAEEACGPLEGYVANADDCDDARASVHPGAPEVCDDESRDEDCDGLVDDGDPTTDASTWTTWYADSDGDGWGDDAAPGTPACHGPSGTASLVGDCDDTNPAVSPSAPETCNTMDDDCDGLVDDTPTDAATSYRDADGDGWGDASDRLVSCTPVSGYVAVAGDCDDSDATVNPDAGCTPVETGDTGIVDYGGAWTGTGSFTLDIPALGMSDSCSWTTYSLTVDMYASPQLAGTGTCTFVGMFLPYGTQTVTTTGNVTADPTVEGTLTVGTALATLITAPWTGTFTDPYTLEGVIAGSTTFGGTFTLDYTGRFLYRR